MENKNKLLEALMKCVEIAYIIEEDTGTVVWANDGAKEHVPDVVGATCWQALGKKAACPFCPKMKDDQFYTWDYYQRNPPAWFKVNNYWFSENGIRYRAGLASTINDTMGLSHDTIEEMSSLQKLLNENRRIKAALEHQASHDSMTGLCNRNCFNLDVASGNFDDPGLGILYFDLNNLKTVNDQYRHSAGDLLIQRLATAVAQTALERPGAVCYRLGGDEFALMINHTTEAELLLLKDRFQTHLNVLDATAEIPCSVAVGTAFSEPSCDAEQLIIVADASMYKEKIKMKGNKQL